MALRREYLLSTKQRQSLRKKCDSAVNQAFHAKLNEVRIKTSPELSEAEYFLAQNGGVGFTGGAQIKRTVEYTFLL